MGAGLCPAAACSRCEAASAALPDQLLRALPHLVGPQMTNRWRVAARRRRAAPACLLPLPRRCRRRTLPLRACFSLATLTLAPHSHTCLDSCAQRRFVTRQRSFTKEEFEALLSHTGMFNGEEGPWLRRPRCRGLCCPGAPQARTGCPESSACHLLSACFAVGGHAADQRMQRSHLPPSKLEGPGRSKRAARRERRPKRYSIFRLPMVRARRRARVRGQGCPAAAA